MSRFILAHDLARRRAVAAVAEAPAGYVVTVEEPRRNLEQNALMWVLLQAFSDQLVWPVNGQMVKLEAEEWKDLLTAAFRQETVRVAMGLRGGMVMLGTRTSKMGKQQMADFITFIQSEAADRGVELQEQEA
jgi:sugar phosphate isomerase/epimerase